MLCGLPRLEHEITQGLIAFGVKATPAASNALLIDAPLGWAPLQLHDLHPAQTLIVSDNPCAEYQLELLEHCPAALLSGVSIREIAEHLKDAADYQPPILASPLTPTERLTLRFSACERSTKQIAQHRDISEGRVKNTVGAVY